MALIVVVDDEILLAELLADLLIGEGHEVVTAAHGRAALQSVRERRPALIIADFMMPLMTGQELAEAIAADPELSGIPIILVSGAQASIARRKNDLFAAVFDKPYQHDELIAAVRQILEGTPG